MALPGQCGAANGTAHSFALLLPRVDRPGAIRRTVHATTLYCSFIILQSGIKTVDSMQTNWYQKEAQCLRHYRLHLSRLGRIVLDEAPR